MKLTCLVDNAVQSGSGLWGEHGLAYLVEVAGRRILYDTGQSGTVLLHNLKQLGVDPASLDAIAISHAHYDHTGGLPALLPHLRPGIPLFANPDLFRERFSRRDDGSARRIGLPLSREELAAHFELKLSPEPQEIAPGVWTTGEISERAEFEGRSKGHLMAEGEALVPDAYRDDMALVLRSPVTETGAGHAGDRLTLLCGCCHAGLLNTLAHVVRIFPQPVALIVGGLHLAGVAERDLQRACEALRHMPTLERVYASHCTGETAFLALARALGTAVVRTAPTGTTIEIA